MKNIPAKAAGHSDRLRQLFARPALSGQAADHADTILAHLVRECQPRDLIEEMWLSDVAWLTARIEYVRSSVVGMYRNGLRWERQGTTSMARGGYLPEFDPAEQQELVAMEELGATPDGTLPVDDPLFQRLLGLVTARRLETVGKLTALEQLLARDRDRVLAQFERRRREVVKEALLTIESKAAGKGDA